MIKINLIPYREKENKDNLKRQIVVITGLTAVFLLLLVAVNLYMNSNLSQLESDVASATARLAILDKQVGDVEKVKKVKIELEKKLDVINKLEVNRYFPIRLLDGLNMLVPTKEIWIEKLTQSGLELRLEGKARDNGSVARFMSSLEKATFIGSVDLVGSKEQDVVGVKLQQFVINCVVVSKGE